MLHCPADDTPLQTDVTHAVTFATCARCAGVWFAREALDRHAHYPSPLPLPSRHPDPTFIAAPATLAAPTGRLRPCPWCHERLTALHVEGIEIDRCDGCGGVWLDAGEYQAVRAHVGALGRPTGGSVSGRRPAAPTGSGLPTLAAEIGLEIGGELAIRAVFATVAALLD